MHTLINPILIYKSYSVATPGHSKPSLLDYHVVIAALTSDLQKVFFHSIIDFLALSIIHRPWISDLAFFVRVFRLVGGLGALNLLVANLAMLCETCIRIGSIDNLFGSLLDFKDRLAVAEKTQAVHKPMHGLNRRIPHHKNWAALTSAAAEGV